MASSSFAELEGIIKILKALIKENGSAVMFGEGVSVLGLQIDGEFATVYPGAWQRSFEPLGTFSAQRPGTLLSGYSQQK